MEIEEITVTMERYKGMPARRFQLPSGFKGKKIIVWESPSELKVLYEEGTIKEADNGKT